MEEKITFTPAMREYWSEHSILLKELLSEDYELEDENVEVEDAEGTISLSRSLFTPLTDSQWKLLKKIVEGETGLFSFGPSGTVYLNSSTEFKPAELPQLLDYLMYATPDTMMAEFAKFVEDFRLARPGKKVGERQTPAQRARAAANTTRRMRAEARRAGVSLRNFLEILEEDRAERKQLRQAASRRAAKKMKKNAVNRNSAARTARRSKKNQWGERRGFTLRRRKPSRFIEAPPNAIDENGFENEVENANEND